MNYIYNYDGLYIEFPMNEDDKDKYVILACAKNEDEYIEEWVTHHLSIGFDKIFICDNNDDETVLKNILNKYIEDGTVELFECRGLVKFQNAFYSMFYKIGNYKWCAYLDCDEFIELSPIYSDIKDFLSNYNEKVVTLNWMLFGSNNQLIHAEGRIQDRFKYPSSPTAIFKENMFMKSIVQGGPDEDGLFEASHYPEFGNKEFKYNECGVRVSDKIGQVSKEICYKHGYIKHYYTKSFEEFINKVNRGWPDYADKNVLNNKNHYFLSNNGVEIPIEFYSTGLFSNEDNEKGKEVLERALDYDIINMSSPSESMYALTIYASWMFKRSTNRTYIIYGYVDNITYNILLECAIKTGNRLAYNETNDKNILNKIYYKYHKSGYVDNYYNLYLD